MRQEFVPQSHWHFNATRLRLIFLQLTYFSLYTFVIEFYIISKTNKIELIRLRMTNCIFRQRGNQNIIACARAFYVYWMEHARTRRLCKTRESPLRLIQSQRCFVLIWILCVGKHSRELLHSLGVTNSITGGFVCLKWMALTASDLNTIWRE